VLNSACSLIFFPLLNFYWLHALRGRELYHQVQSGKKVRFCRHRRTPIDVLASIIILHHRRPTKIYGDHDNRTPETPILCLPSKSKARWVQSTALQECVRRSKTSISPSLELRQPWVWRQFGCGALGKAVTARVP